jgi:hypothetical protein
LSPSIAVRVYPEFAGRSAKNEKSCGRDGAAGRGLCRPLAAARAAGHTCGMDQRDDYSDFGSGRVPKEYQVDWMVVVLLGMAIAVLTVMLLLLRSLWL